MALAQAVALRAPLVHEQLELHASAQPDAPALRFGDAELSYGELNARANRLARYLSARGLSREARVVVCLEPSFDVVVALLALLKLGSVYVPLDPAYPEARLRAIVDDTQPRFVLTQSAIRQRLPFAGAPTLELDRADAELGRLPSENLDHFCDVEQPAYIYYTSGTTGSPKGVVATQANLASYIGSAVERYGFAPSDVGVALARFSFSISMFELMTPLVAGGTLLILERAHILDFPRLAETLSQATYFHAGPSLLRGLLGYLERHPHLSRFRKLRHASSGGDMVPVELLERMRRVFEDAEIFVIYGCSEISCMGTTYAAPRAGPLVRSYVGRPFTGTTLRVVDEELRDVATDVVGEVLFAGPGVVLGYLNRPELTAERFVLHDGARFYKTGDRGRLNAEGVLELVGRADFQVKIGGIRVELGEIEHHLRRAPGVANGVVSAKTVAGETALVAYLVTEDGATGTSDTRAAAVREFLARQLPDYMVPALYVELSALPLNHNAKLDRRALPDPCSVPSRQAAAATLATPTERRLAAICCEILGVEARDGAQNFFELGGTSLRALQLLQQVERQLGVTLTGLELLREPLSVLAMLCDRRMGSASLSHVARSAAVPASQPLHFGGDNELYGVLHGVPTLTSRTAVLICEPTGHERLRAYFVLQQLARRLATRGVCCLRFDYFGCGDSLGESEQATLARWQRDIVTAHRELRRRTGAERVVGVGARLGASLLAAVADELKLERLVLWDPVWRGAEYRAQLAVAEKRYRRANALGPWLGRQSAARERELLGTAYSAPALAELSRLVFGWPATSETKIFSSDCAWLELSQLENMLPDAGISASLSALLEQP